MRRIAVAVAAIVSLSGNFTRTAPARQEAGRVERDQERSQRALNHASLSRAASSVSSPAPMERG